LPTRSRSAASWSPPASSSWSATCRKSTPSRLRTMSSSRTISIPCARSLRLSNENGRHGSRWSVVVDSLLEQSADRSPQQVALICGGERRTYRQLDEQANRFAHALISAGVEPGDRVAVCLGNSIDAVVSLFAVRKAGGACFA